MGKGNAQEAHGGPQHASPASYVGWTVVMVGLSLIAFFAVGMGWLPSKILIPLLLAMAAVQVAAQLWLFMHLNISRRWYLLMFAVGIGFGLIFAYTVWYLTWWQ
ncbi:MAG: cytochrome C oxidase subunit IV family protein [Clostridia bacterium]|nr:cytochrome C oxidase subunit IV family protein [Clostridia bacterium]